MFGIRFAVILALVAVICISVIGSLVDAQNVVSNGRIAFASKVDGDLEIYTINPDGTDRQQLTHNTDDDRYPDWSPDGNKIVFRSTLDSPRSNDIFVMNSDGTSMTNLTNSAFQDATRPKWSPNGDKIAFLARNGSGNLGIVVMNPDGSTPAFISGIDKHIEVFNWSPDSQKFIYRTPPPSRIGSGGVTDFYIMDADGSNDKFLIEGEHFSDQTLDWSQNGQILFGENMWVHLIGIMNSDGNSRYYLGREAYPDDPNTPLWRIPVWSPDGMRIAAVGKGSQIQTLDPDGTDVVTVIQENSFIDSLAWQPIISSSPSTITSVTLVDAVTG